MAVTASRLGIAPITLDWSNLLRKHDSDTELFRETWTRLKSRFNPSDVGFYDSPVQPEISQIHEAQNLAEILIKKNLFTDCLFIGIGGSSLGPLSLLSALQERCNTGIRFHFMENPDPTEWKTTIRQLRPDSTLVCSVTKSGTTFETMALTLLALEWLGKSRWKSQFVAITDPSRGDLRDFVTEEGLQSLSVAPSMGGRFSIFTPVGLFPAALAGLSTQNFMLGAKQVRDYLEKTPIEKIPLFILGHEFIRQYSKRPIHVCMPYSSRLKTFGNWFVQLWGESLGKNGLGFTPVAAVGATDQHSILQLLRDGPDDKVTFFISIDEVEGEVMIPKSPEKRDRKTYPAFKLLENHSLHELLEVEYRATSLVLTRQARPHYSICLDRLDERSLGALYFTFATLTAFTGTLWNINPFDQPGVQEGKNYILEALSRNPPEAPQF